ncbi:MULTISPECIES: ArnT family glycosyltransferase [Olivibacter]|uniref:ArnT family glycosyltransferase n=1 Tax=Olivibacter oleidegradans TaxID=760123 RepID=A0ABV6HKR0_9SPHI|nr:MULTISPECIES: glycosyltransferase family 39 protein [Olivibacter]MDM8174614.1 glycosyltransferase family 39 protein [Olivibacter sp. 47]
MMHIYQRGSTNLEEKAYYIVIWIIAFISIFSLFGGVMEPDGALYASIAKNMLLYNDWLNLYVRGQDWLDKPHLTFWLAASSFKLLGISGFAYKLPSLLFGWLGSYYLYLLGSKLYKRRIALIAVVMFMTAFHVVISNFDVRAEIYLTTFTLAAVFHYYIAYRSLSYHVIPGSFFLACGIMVKGIFVIIPVLSGFICYWIITKQYREFIKLKWWLALLLVGIFILPELYALYIQFDMHPEKVIFNQQNVSGIRFFFWDSQFGRFFNTGPIKGKGDVSFFLHTTLWAFLPWSVIFYIAVFNKLKKRSIIGKKKATTLIINSNALVAFLLFSFSEFQLPHYIIIVFPHFALFTASYLSSLKHKKLKAISIIQQVIFVLVLVLLIMIAFVFDVPFKFLFVVLALLTGTIAYILFFRVSVRNLVCLSAVSAVIFMLFAYAFFYPTLLRYQAGMVAGRWLQNHHPNGPVKSYLGHRFSFDFYAPTKVEYVDDISQLKSKSDNKQIVFLPTTNVPDLTSKYQVKILKNFSDYHITKLKWGFLNHKTREKTLTSFSLVELRKIQ